MNQLVNWQTLICEMNYSGVWRCNRNVSMANERGNHHHFWLDKFFFHRMEKYSAEQTSFDSISYLMCYIKWGPINLAILIRSWFFSAHLNLWLRIGVASLSFSHWNLCYPFLNLLKKFDSDHFLGKCSYFQWPLNSALDVYSSLRLKMNKSTIQMKIICFYCVVISISHAKSDRFE